MNKFCALLAIVPVTSVLAACGSDSTSNGPSGGGGSDSGTSPPGTSPAKDAGLPSPDGGGGGGTSPKKIGEACAMATECDTGLFCTFYSGASGGGICYPTCSAGTDCSSHAGKLGAEAACCKLNNVPSQVCVPGNLASGAPKGACENIFGTDPNE